MPYGDRTGFSVGPRVFKFPVGPAYIGREFSINQQGTGFIIHHQAFCIDQPGFEKVFLTDGFDAAGKEQGGQENGDRPQAHA